MDDIGTAEVADNVIADLLPKIHCHIHLIEPLMGCWLFNFQTQLMSNTQTKDSICNLLGPYSQKQGLVTDF